MPKLLEVILIINHSAFRLLFVGLAAAQLIIGVSTASVFVVLSPMAVRATESDAVPISAPTPIDLDLTSTTASLPAPKFVEASPVSIMVGGVAVAVTSTSVLTPGERLAAYQVFSEGQQSIVLGALGNALGGSFNIGPKFGQYVNNLVVPEGVTAIQNAATAASVHLVGNLINAGAIFAISTNPEIMSISINALNIINQQGATLTSVLPSGGIPGFSGAVTGLNLNLNAISNIINSGTISSAGTLSLHAGGTITNALPAGIAGSGATLMALNQLTMQAASIINAGQILSQQGALNVYTANVTNSGLIQSMLSDVNVQNLLGNTLTVASTAGTMQALGSIDFQTLPTNTLGKGGINLIGGTLTAQTVNFVSPEGIIHVTGDTVNGVINISGGEALVGVDNGTLSIASLNLTGDPVVYNTNGDLIIDLALFNAALTIPGQDWTFLAGGNILGGAGTVGQTFNTGSGANGLLTLAAGVTFTPTGGVGTVIVPGPVVPFIINAGTSATGGNIQLSGINLQTDGRAISLQARGVLLGNPGTIDIGNISSSGLSVQPGGTISIIASGAITSGTITSIGGAGFNGGAISVVTGQSFSSNSVLSAGGAGGIGLAGGSGGAILLWGAGNSMVIGTITSRGGDGGAGVPGGAAGAGGTGGDISLIFGGDIGGQQVLARGGDGGIGIPGGAGGGGGTGGNISLAAGQDITTVATLSIGGNGGAGGVGDPGGLGGNAGTGGNISMVAARDVLADTVISFGGLGGIGGLCNSPFAGGQGGNGGSGGTGGNISLTSSGRDIITCQVVSFGGFGGAGALGRAGVVGGQGGMGGFGAVGGNISLTAFRDILAEGLVSIGGDGGVGALGDAGAAGGTGGAGAGGGTGGNISITAGRSSITGDVVSLGGFGGVGGAGQSVGVGGAGGAGGGGATGGDISVTTGLDIVGNNFISKGGIGGAGGNGLSGLADGAGGAAGGGGRGGDISLTAGRDAIVCCVMSTGGIGGAGGSGQAFGAGGSGGAGGLGGRGGDLSVIVGRDSLVDKLITIGGAGGAGGSGLAFGAGGAGGAGSGGGRGGDISVTAAATIFRDIITATGGIGGLGGFGTPPGAAGSNGIDGTISLMTPNPTIDFIAPQCINCIEFSGGAIQAIFRPQIMTALAANAAINCDDMMIQTQSCPLPPPPPVAQIINATIGGIPLVAGGLSLSSLSTQTLASVALPFAVSITVGNQCVSYYVHDAKESFLQATEGTQVQVSSAEGVMVSNGQVVVKAGSDELILTPSSARVTLKPQSVVSIEARPGQPTTIVALDALGENGVTVQVGDTAYTLQPGEQIQITDKPTREKLVQGARTVDIRDSVQKQVYVLKASINLLEYIPKMTFLQCRDCAFRNHIESKYQESGNLALTGSIEMRTPSKSLENVSCAAGFSLGSQTSIKAVGKDHFKLENGSFLLQSQGSTRIDTPHGQLFVENGAIVLVTVTARLTRVRDLHDSHSKGVVLLAGGCTINLGPGKEATICNTMGEALSLVYEDGMSRRDVNLTDHDGLQIVTADFSILNAFMLQPLLLQLNCSNAANDVRTKKMLMKTCSAISLGIDRYKGPYFAPVVTPGTGLSAKPLEVTYEPAR